MCKNTSDEIRYIINKYKNGRILQQRQSPIADTPIEPFYEILSFLYLSNGGNNNEVIRILSESTYKTGFINNKEEEILVTNYKETVECILNVSVNPDFYISTPDLPRELSSFISTFFKKETEDTTIYNPFSGLCPYALNMPNFHFIGEENDPIIWAIAQIRLHANQITADISNYDSYANIQDASQKFKYIISSLPYKWTNDFDDKIIFNLYNKLEDDGLMAIIVSSTFLTHSKAHLIRKKLVEDHAIKTIFLLPANLFIQMPTKKALLLITKSTTHKQDFITMIDASTAVKKDRSYSGVNIFDAELLKNAIKNQTENNPIYKKITIDDILKRNNLNPKIYLQQLPENGISLEQLVSFYKGRKHTITDSICKVIRIANLSSEFPRFGINLNKIALKSLTTYTYRKLTTPALLFSINRDTPLVGFIDNIENIKEDILVSHNISILIPKEGYSFQYIALLLLLPEVKQQLYALTMGSPFPLITANDLKSIIVPFHSEKEREQLVQQALKDSMTEIEIETEQKRIEYQREIRSRKHAISQNLSSFSALWNVLKSYRQFNNGQINETDVIGQMHPISIREIFESLDSRLNTLIIQTENLADVEYNWGNSISIDPQKFIQTYIKEHCSTEYQILYTERINHAESDLELPEENEIILHKGDSITTIEFPVKALARVFDNIISNAVSHGFGNQANPNNKIYINWYVEEKNCIITIANNGLPLKDGTELSNVFTYGYSTALNKNNAESGHKHSGIGAYDAKNILEKEGAKIEIISTPNEEYTVTYKLTFTKTNIAAIF